MSAGDRKVGPPGPPPIRPGPAIGASPSGASPAPLRVPQPRAAPHVVVPIVPQPSTAPPSNPSQVSHVVTPMPMSAPLQSTPGMTSTGRIATVQPEDRSKVCPVCQSRYPTDFIVCPKDATKLEQANEDDDPLLGAMLNNTYQIIRIIGEGGMGKVYEAKHLRLSSRRFAIKVLHAEYARHADVLSRFQREAEAAAAIAHAHVMEVFDVARTDDGRPFIASEFLEGQDFHDFLEARGKLDLPSSVAIARQVAGALAAAHAAGVVHRDMKPENIFVLKNRLLLGRQIPVVKVLDFGISKVKGHGGETNLTRTGMIMGTPNYMAPEQARGEKVDHRVDVYALGAILYRMVTGKRAFDGTDPGAVITAVLNDEPIRPRELEPSIPESFEVVVQRAMAKDARDRYQSMEEFDRALSAFDVSGAALSIAPPAITIAPIGATSADGKDAHARTYAGGEIQPASSSVVAPRVIERRKELEVLERAGREAKIARPTIVVLTPVTSAWILSLVVALSAGLVRIVTKREVLESEVLLMTIFAAVAGIFPLVFFIIHVAKNVWRNSVRSMELAGDMRRFMAGSLVAYGAIVVLVRLILTLFVRNSTMVASGWWDVLGFVVAMIGAFFGGGIGPLARLRRRLLNT